MHHPIRIRALRLGLAACLLAGALALTRLPAKYVVLPAEHKKPMLSLYQARYDGDVTTQVIYACKAVMDAPRHGAAQPGLASDRG